MGLPSALSLSPAYRSRLSGLGGPELLVPAIKLGNLIGSQRELRLDSGRQYRLAAAGLHIEQAQLHIGLNFSAIDPPGGHLENSTAISRGDSREAATRTIQCLNDRWCSQASLTYFGEGKFSGELFQALNIGSRSFPTAEQNEVFARKTQAAIADHLGRDPDILRNYLEALRLPEEFGLTRIPICGTLTKTPGSEIPETAVYLREFQLLEGLETCDWGPTIPTGMTQYLTLGMEQEGHISQYIFHDFNRKYFDGAETIMNRILTSNLIYQRSVQPDADGLFLLNGSRYHSLISTTCPDPQDFKWVFPGK